jgi:hypothetical protein
MEANIDQRELKTRIKMAADWLTDTAQVKTDSLPEDTENRQKYPYHSWKGIIRTEYQAAEKTWWLFGPIWHTGQAIKALLSAERMFNEHKYLEAARLAASFILDKQIWDKDNPDHGLILAFEDFMDKINTSAILECLDGFFAGRQGKTDGFMASDCRNWPVPTTASLPAARRSFPRPLRSGIAFRGAQSLPDKKQLRRSATS